MPAPAAASSPPTRWPLSARRSASPRSAAAACRRPTPTKAGRRAPVGAAGRRRWRPRELQPRDDHHAARRSRTRSRSSRRPADRPTRCCTCSRSRSEAGVELDARRLRSHQREDAAHRRPQAVGPLRRDRSARGRRQPARDQAADRGAARSTATRRRSPAAPWPRRRRRATKRPGQEVVRPIERAAQAARRPGDSLRQPRAGRRRAEAVGHRARAAPRAGARVRQRGGGVRGRAAAGDQAGRRRRDPLRRAERAVPACARCSA